MILHISSSHTNLSISSCGEISTTCPAPFPCAACGPIATIVEFISLVMRSLSLNAEAKLFTTKAKKQRKLTVLKCISYALLY